MKSSAQTQFEDSLVNRVAVITGASSGIGSATAKVLAARGARIAVIARRGDRLTALVNEIKSAGGTAVAYTADIIESTSLEMVASRIRTDLGTPGILINNAGVMLPAPMLENRAGDWSRMIDLNLTALVNAIGVFAPDLVKAAEAQGGADLLNVSSVAANQVYPNFSVYSATKAAVSHLSRTLRTEFGPKNVRVSTVEPGIVMTELANHVTDKATQDWIFGAWKNMEVLQSDDIADVIAFTVSRPRHVNLDQVSVLPTAMV